MLTLNYMDFFKLLDLERELEEKYMQDAHSQQHLQFEGKKQLD